MDNLAVFRPSCFLRVVRRPGTERVLQTGGRLSSSTNQAQKPNRKAAVFGGKCKCITISTEQVEICSNPQPRGPGDYVVQTSTRGPTCDTRLKATRIGQVSSLNRQKVTTIFFKGMNELGNDVGMKSSLDIRCIGRRDKFYVAKTMDKGIVRTLRRMRYECVMTIVSTLGSGENPFRQAPGSIDVAGDAASIALKKLDHHTPNSFSPTQIWLA
ncbi:hypothetical protein CLF_103258 [Clonorchis sinensis]|uniref:Uncharacterized protein n=1 Tax=Clonorchis sinensis TaxID=79923 RepID=G7Y9F0_CLOSI|nr:hypothetical protein CLF_103258 [Clonorchis sinensis]